MFSALSKYINILPIDSIPIERKKVLAVLVEYLKQKQASNQAILLNFICTHNSRRSHLAQVWAQTMANYFKVSNVWCYSSGTEATALYPMVLQTLKKAGFQNDRLVEGSNPIYTIKYADNEPAIIGFSKNLDHSFNPKSAFAAIVTCSEADKACPFITGADLRIPIRYEDPKAFDNSEDRAEKYEERSRQIATEMAFVFSIFQIALNYNEK
jgi:arsenate reductase